MRVSELERDKYAKVWDLTSYSAFSPGASFIDKFWQLANPQPGQTILDVGAGSGAASRILKDRGLKVDAFDLTGIGWKQNNIPLQLGSIWKDLTQTYYHRHFDYAYCCDVMEHIPTEYVGLALNAIMDRCDHCFFSIAFQPDEFGHIVGQPLHLTVKPFTWWRGVFRELGTLLDARDVIGQGLFYARR